MSLQDFYCSFWTYMAVQGSKVYGFPLLLQEFDSTYGPAWHCIVGTSFGSYVTHSLGGFLYFSIDKVYVLLFKTAVEPLSHWQQISSTLLLFWNSRMECICVKLKKQKKKKKKGSIFLCVCIWWVMTNLLNNVNEIVKLLSPTYPFVVGMLFQFSLKIKQNLGKSVWIWVMVSSSAQKYLFQNLIISF